MSLLNDFYDLKGSRYGRTTKEADILKGDPKKDNNLIDDKLKLEITGFQKDRLIHQL